MSISKNDSVKVDLGIKAEAKLEVKTEIPAETTGRLVDSFTDIIRPFSEARGLRADRIRLQREETAIEIARLAMKKKQLMNQEIEDLSPKFLVPFFERASLEDIDSEIVEMWANLLASATSDSTTDDLFVVDILSKMSGREAKAFKSICSRAKEALHLPTEEYGTIRIEVLSSFISGRVEEEWKKAFGKTEPKTELNPSDVLKAAYFGIGKQMSRYGVPIIAEIDVWGKSGVLRKLGWDSSFMDEKTVYSVSDDEHIEYLDNLRKLGLVEFVNVRLEPRLFDLGSVHFNAFFVRITRDGIIFKVSIGEEF